MLQTASPSLLPAVLSALVCSLRIPQNLRRGRGQILHARREARRPAGGGTALSPSPTFFEAGLHEYLDCLQTKLNDIGGVVQRLHRAEFQQPRRGNHGAAGGAAAAIRRRADHCGPCAPLAGLPTVQSPVADDSNSPARPWCCEPRHETYRYSDRRRDLALNATITCGHPRQPAQG